MFKEMASPSPNGALVLSLFLCLARRTGSYLAYYLDGWIIPLLQRVQAEIHDIGNES